MPVPGYLHSAGEEIDAAIFSGDVLYQKESRKELESYVARWAAATAETETV